MPFTLAWTDEAREKFEELQEAAARSLVNRGEAGRSKASKAEGLFKKVVKCVDLLAANPRHPGLQTHEYSSLINPYDKKAKVFEAYVQNRTPGAYRLFCCYGPDKTQITVLAITPHP
jgi:hypothetical protein